MESSWLAVQIKFPIHWFWILRACLKNFQLDSLGKNNESLLLFKDKVIDFGTIMEKQTSEILIYFPYANIGQSRLVIIKTDVSCNCLTAVNKSPPLSRGEVGSIEVLVNIRNKKGVFNKAIFIKSNATNDIEIIRVKGFIK